MDASPNLPSMAEDASNEQNFDLFVDDAEFNPDVLEPGRRLPQHATATGDRPIVPRPAPPRQIPSLDPTTPPTSENNPGFGIPSRQYPGSLPPQQQQQRARIQSASSYPATANYAQQSYIQPPGNSPLGGTDTSASSSSNLFEYNPQVTAADDSAYREYISPTIVHGNAQAAAFGYQMPWGGGGDADSSTATLTNTAPPESLSNIPNPWLDNDDDELDDEYALSVADDVDMDATSRSGASYRNKRQKKGTRVGDQAGPTRRRHSEDAKATSPSATAYSQNSRASLGSKASTLTSAAPGTTDASRPSKLRSASRTSKNTHHKPAESAEERRTRASHNLVEKQYRNRLNAQFESLLNALPEQVRSGGGDGDESDPPLDFTDKRVSKAEVLDMARRYIKALERERDALERERNELLGSIERLRESYKRGGPPYDDDGAGGAAAASMGFDTRNDGDMGN